MFLTRIDNDNDNDTNTTSTLSEDKMKTVDDNEIENQEEEDEIIKVSKSKRKNYFEDSFVDEMKEDEEDEIIDDDIMDEDFVLENDENFKNESEEVLNDSIVESEVQVNHETLTTLNATEYKEKAKNFHRKVYDVCLIQDIDYVLSASKSERVNIYDGLRVNKKYDDLVASISFKSFHPQTIYEIMNIAYDFTLKMIKLSSKYTKLSNSFIILKDDYFSQISILKRNFSQLIKDSNNSIPPHHSLLQILNILTFLNEDIIKVITELSLIDNETGLTLSNSLLSLENIINNIIKKNYSDNVENFDSSISFLEFLDKFNSFFSNFDTLFLVKLGKKIVNSFKSIYERIERCGFEIFRRCEIEFFNNKFKKFKKKYNLSFSLSQLKNICYLMESISINWPSKLISIKKIIKEIQNFIHDELDIYEDISDDDDDDNEEDEEVEEIEREFVQENIKKKRPIENQFPSENDIFSFNYSTLATSPVSNLSNNIKKSDKNIIARSKYPNATRIKSTLRKINLLPYYNEKESNSIINKLKSKSFNNNTLINDDEEIILVNAFQKSRNLKSIQKVSKYNRKNFNRVSNYRNSVSNNSSKNFDKFDNMDNFNDNFETNVYIKKKKKKYFEKSKYYNFIKDKAPSNIYIVEHDQALYDPINLNIPLSIPTLDSISLNYINISTYSSTSEDSTIKLPHLSFDKLLVDPKLVSSYRSNYIDQETVNNLNFSIENYEDYEKITFLDNSNIDQSMDEENNVEEKIDEYKQIDWCSLSKLWKNLLNFECDFYIYFILNDNTDLKSNSLKEIQSQKERNEMKLIEFFKQLLYKSRVESTIENNVLLPKYFQLISMHISYQLLCTLLNNFPLSDYNAIIFFICFLLEHISEVFTTNIREIIFIESNEMNNNTKNELIWRKYREIEVRICFILKIFIQFFYDNYQHEILFLIFNSFFQSVKTIFIENFVAILTEKYNLSRNFHNSSAGNSTVKSINYPTTCFEFSYSLPQLLNWLFDNNLFFNYPLYSDISVRFYSRITSFFLKLSSKYIRITFNSSGLDKKEIFSRISVISCAVFDSLQLELLTCLSPTCSPFITTQASWLVTSISDSNLNSLMWKLHLISLPHQKSLKLSECTGRLKLLLKLNNVSIQLDELNKYFDTSSMYMGQTVGWILLIIMEILSFAELQRQFTSSISISYNNSSSSVSKLFNSTITSLTPNSQLCPFKSNINQLLKLVKNNKYWEKINLFLYLISINKLNLQNLREDSHYSLEISKYLVFDIPSDSNYKALLEKVNYNILWTLISVSNHSLLSIIDLNCSNFRISNNWNVLNSIFDKDLTRNEIVNSMYRFINLASLWDTPTQIFDLLIELTKKFVTKISHDITFTKNCDQHVNTLTPQTAIIHLIVSQHHSLVQLHQSFGHIQFPNYKAHTNHIHYINGDIYSKFSSLTNTKCVDPINSLMNRIIVNHKLSINSTTRLHHLLLQSINNSVFGNFVMNKILSNENNFIEGDNSFNSILDSIDLIRSLYKIYFQNSLNLDSHHKAYSDLLSVNNLKIIIKANKNKFLELFSQAPKFENGLLLLFLYKEILSLVMDDEFDNYDEFIPDLLSEFIKIESLSQDSLLDMQLRTLLLFVTAIFTCTPFSIKTSRIFHDNNEFDAGQLINIHDPNYQWNYLLDIQKNNIKSQKIEFSSVNLFLEVIELLIKIIENYVLNNTSITNDKETILLTHFVLDLVLSVSISLSHIITYIHSKLIPINLPKIDLKNLNKFSMINFLSLVLSQVYCIFPEELLKTISNFIILLNKLYLKEKLISSIICKSYHFDQIIVLLSSITNNYLYNYYISVIAPLTEIVSICKLFSSYTLSSTPKILNGIEWLNFLKNEIVSQYLSINIENVNINKFYHSFSLGIDVFGGLYNLLDEDGILNNVHLDTMDNMVYPSYFKILNPKILYNLFDNKFRKNLKIRNFNKNISNFHIPSVGNHSNTIASFIKIFKDYHINNIKIPNNIWTPSLNSNQKGYSTLAPIVMNDLDTNYDITKMANISLFSTWNLLSSWSEMLHLLSFSNFFVNSAPNLNLGTSGTYSTNMNKNFYVQLEDSIQPRIIDSIYILFFSALSIPEQSGSDEVISNVEFNYKYYNHSTLTPNLTNNNISNRITKIGVTSINRYAFNLFQYLNRKNVLVNFNYSYDWHELTKIFIDSFLEIYNSYLAIMDMELEMELEIEESIKIVKEVPQDLLSVDDTSLDYWKVDHIPAIDYKFSIDLINMIYSKVSNYNINFNTLKLLRTMMFSNFLR